MTYLSWPSRITLLCFLLFYASGIFNDNKKDASKKVVDKFDLRLLELRIKRVNPFSDWKRILWFNDEFYIQVAFFSTNRKGLTVSYSRFPGIVWNARGNSYPCRWEDHPGSSERNSQTQLSQTDPREGTAPSERAGQARGSPRYIRHWVSGAVGRNHQRHAEELTPEQVDDLSRELANEE